MKVSLSLPSEAQAPGGATAVSSPTLAAAAPGSGDFLQWMGLVGKNLGDASGKSSLPTPATAKATEDLPSEAAPESESVLDEDSPALTKAAASAPLTTASSYDGTSVGSLRLVSRGAGITPVAPEVQPTATGAETESDAKVAEMQEPGQSGLAADQNRSKDAATNIQATTVSVVAEATKAGKSAPARAAKTSAADNFFAVAALIPKAAPKTASGSFLPPIAWQGKTSSATASSVANNKAITLSAAEGSAVSIDPSETVAAAPAKSSKETAQAGSRSSVSQNYFGGSNSPDAATVTPSLATGLAPMMAPPVSLAPTSIPAPDEKKTEIGLRSQMEQDSTPQNRESDSASNTPPVSSPSGTAPSYQSQTGRTVFASANASVASQSGSVSPAASPAPVQLSQNTVPQLPSSLLSTAIVADPVVTEQSTISAGGLTSDPAPVSKSAADSLSSPVAQAEQGASAVKQSNFAASSTSNPAVMDLPAVSATDGNESTPSASPAVSASPVSSNIIDALPAQTLSNNDGRSAGQQSGETSVALPENATVVAPQSEAKKPLPAGSITISSAAEKNAASFPADRVKQFTPEESIEVEREAVSKTAIMPPQTDDAGTEPLADDVAESAANFSEDTPNQSPLSIPADATPAPTISPTLAEITSAKTPARADDAPVSGAAQSISNLAQLTPASDGTEPITPPDDAAETSNALVDAGEGSILESSGGRAVVIEPGQSLATILPPVFPITPSQTISSDSTEAKPSASATIKPNNPVEDATLDTNAGQLAAFEAALLSSFRPPGSAVNSDTSGQPKTAHANKAGGINSAKISSSDKMAPDTGVAAQGADRRSQSAVKTEVAPADSSSSSTENLSGTPVAIQQEHMKNAANVNEIAEATMHNLPSLGLMPSAVAGVDNGSQGATAPRSLEIDFSNHQDAAAQWMANISQGSSSTVATTANTLGSSASASSPLNTVEQMINREVSMVRQSGAQALAVTLKVDSSTNLFLQLTNHNGQIEAAVRCDSGASGALGTHWGALQESLARQNVQLQPLQENSREQSNWPSSTAGNFDRQSPSQQQSNSNAQRMAEEELTPSDEATSAAGSAKPRPQSRHGWEKWA
jgi:hypothetical protein